MFGIKILSSNHFVHHDDTDSLWTWLLHLPSTNTYVSMETLQMLHMPLYIFRSIVF